MNNRIDTPQLLRSIAKRLVMLADIPVVDRDNTPASNDELATECLSAASQYESDLARGNAAIKQHALDPQGMIDAARSLLLEPSLSNETRSFMAGLANLAEIALPEIGSLVEATRELERVKAESKEKVEELQIQLDGVRSTMVPRSEVAELVGELARFKSVYGEAP